MESDSLVQVFNGSLKKVASYDSNLKQLNVLHVPPGYFPPGNTTVFKYHSPKGTVVVFSLSIGLVFLFLTITLFLYIVFRNEPEIKVTSFSVSICIYLGNYLTLFFAPLYFLDMQPTSIVGPVANDVICNVLFWLGGTGTPILLVITCLLLKLARVYAIYVRCHTYKVKLCSDGFLFLYIAIIMLPQIFILVLLTATAYKNHIRYTTTRSQIITTSACGNNHTQFWLFVSC